MKIHVLDVDTLPYPKGEALLDNQIEVNRGLIDLKCTHIKAHEPLCKLLFISEGFLKNEDKWTKLVEHYLPQPSSDEFKDWIAFDIALVEKIGLKRSEHYPWPIILTIDGEPQGVAFAFADPSQSLLSRIFRSSLFHREIEHLCRTAASIIAA